MIDFISIGGIKPDLLLILCVWITLSEGQYEGLITAFVLGLLNDIVSFDVIGTNALSKVVAADLWQTRRFSLNIGGMIT